MSILSTFANKVNDKLMLQSKETKDKLYKTLDIDFMEKTKYFELNAQSFAMGIIDLELSQFVYNKLRDYDNTTLTERIIITQLMSELLQKRRLISNV